MSPLLCPPMEKDGSEGVTMSSGLKANFETLKKRKLDEASTQKIAEETAQLVESEIQLLRNSVAELEAMLAAREGSDDEVDSAGDDDEADDLPEKNPFPLLLPDVVAIPDTGFVPSEGGSDDGLDSHLDGTDGSE